VKHPSQHLPKPSWHWFAPLVAVFFATGASAQTGTGLTGQYYDTNAFTTLLTTRNDAEVNFNWGTAIPAGTALTNADTFSVIWTGQIEPQFTETYTFLITADDSATLWVDDQVVAHRAFPQSSAPITGQIKLKAGQKVNIRIEYTEQTSNAFMKLEWASQSRTREVVPVNRLHPYRVGKAGGSLMKEHWSGIPGGLISTLTGNANYPNKPGGREFVTNFECLAQDWADGYGTRVTGFIVPPVSGNYTFATSGDDVVNLYLSTDSTTANKTLIASVATATAFRQWDANPASQQSAIIPLVQGRRYYVELLHKENIGPDHWSVAWKKPGETTFSVIPGGALMQAGIDRVQPAQAAILDTVARDHPRLYATDESFARLRARWQSTTASPAKSWAENVISQANAVLPTTPVAYPLNVDTARVVMNNMYKLSLAWQLTGDTDYPERAWTELSAVAAFADWFPDGRTFLVTSETTHGFAIAYDWMYPYWTQARRDTIRTALINKGLNVGLSSYKANFWALRANCTSANWSLVCNSGLVTGALAVGTESETLCEDILNRAMNSIRSNLKRFTTDQGAVHEGFTYLEYAQQYAVRGLAGLEWTLGSDFGLSATQAFSETANVPIFTGGPSGLTFCASDDAQTALRRGFLWPWSARRFNQPVHNAWNNATTNGGALDALWYAEGGLTPAAAGAQPDMAFKGETGTAFKSQEYSAMRSRWNDPRSTFIAAKAGEIFTSHGHYDIGTFTLDALGKRWFHDLGKELYSIEASAPRADIYRYRAEGHNTLVIDPGTGPGITNPSFSPLVSFQGKSSGAGSFTIYDLTGAYSGTMRTWRGMRMIGGRNEVLLQDEIQATTGKNVWWFAHYAHPASVATLGADATSVTLTQGSERLWCKIVSGGGTFQIMDAAPLASSPNPSIQSTNSGFKKLAVNLTNVTNSTLAVWFVPLDPGEAIPTTLPVIEPLANWQIDPANYPPDTSDDTAVIVNNQPVDVDLSLLATDDNTPAAALFFALSNIQGGAATLLADGRTARFTPIPGAGGSAGFSFTATDAGGLTSRAASIQVGGAPIDHTWTSLANGTWNTPANWFANLPPTSYRGTNLRFLPDQTLTTGASITATNDLPGTTQANTLSLRGSLASGTATVNLAGNPLQLASNGPVLPTITLSGPTSGFTYNIANAIELAADTTLNGLNSGRVNFNGIISGSGGLTRTGSYGTLVLANNNTYTGPTSISSGGLQIGNAGATGSFGRADVTLNGPLTLNRTNAWTLANEISGSGSIIHSGTGTTTLSANNSFTGNVTVNAGTLKITSSEALGTGTKSFFMQGTNRVLQLSNNITLDPNITLTVSTNSGDGAGISSIDGNNRIEGPVNISTGNPGLNISCTAGSLHISGNITSTTTGRTLYLGGSSTGANTVSGVIRETVGNLLTVIKQGNGTWTWTAANTYTGATAINGGTLLVNGSVASPAALTIASGARLAGSGSIASPITVTGTLAPGSPFGTLTAPSSINFGAVSKLQWELGNNNLLAADKVNAGPIAVTAGAKIDVVLDTPGSTTNFLNSFWRTPRSFPVIAGSSMTGAFTMGTTSADAGGRPAATYGSFSLQNTATGTNLVWTPIPGFPIIDEPVITLVSPSGPTVSIPDAGHSLRLLATVSSSISTTLTWSQVSGPSGATFENPAAADTQVSFHDQGAYMLRCTVSNAVGVASRDFSVFVALPSSMSLREGVNDYSHQTTFIRGDGENTTWNSGARDQILIGRTSGPFRGLLSFDIPEIPPGATIESVDLDLFVAPGGGTGTVPLNPLELRKLNVPFLEGTGNSASSASVGTGTGADWLTRTGDTGDPWATPGGASGTDYAPTVLGSFAGFIPASTPEGTPLTFTSSPALTAAVASAAGSTEPLGLFLSVSNDNTGGTLFGRLASNDHSTLEWRPQLTIHFMDIAAPTISTGSAPAATTGQFAAINGSTTGASSPQWTLLSGPGVAFFGNPALASTTVMFTEPGTYVIGLSAANTYGETRRTLTITATGTALTDMQVWRQQHFGTTANEGAAADSSDADHDGEINLIEFATGQNPHASARAVTSAASTPAGLEFSYLRSKAAFDQGCGFIVEYSDTLGPPWISAGSGTVETDGTLQTLKALIPAGPAGNRFARLKIVSP
jgi:autotransporter-associated beta strand protein